MVAGPTTAEKSMLPTELRTSLKSALSPSAYRVVEHVLNKVCELDEDLAPAEWFFSAQGGESPNARLVIEAIQEKYDQNCEKVSVLELGRGDPAELNAVLLEVDPINTFDPIRLLAIRARPVYLIGQHKDGHYVVAAL